MILSMTGYGTGSAQKDGAMVSVEIKTVNHRFLDCHTRISREYQFLEGEIQQLIRGALDRGRVDVSLTIQNASSATFEVNSSLLRGYIEAANSMQEEFSIPGSLDLQTILHLPGIVQVKETVQTEPSSTLSELAAGAVTAALDGVLRMRLQEGEALRADMQKNLNCITENAGRIEQMSVDLAPKRYQKLSERISQLLGQTEMDPQRLAQEVALIADKSDISEEIARLKSHIDQFRLLMDAKEKAGKKLDFLLQELQREANTILSKSADLEISHCAIAIKTDIEKLREQVQNVE